MKENTLNQSQAPRQVPRLALSLLLPLLGILLLLPEPDTASAASWWNADWRFRRRIDVPLLAQKVRDALAVSAKFLCSGALKADGSDLRVVSKSGKVLKSALKGIGPGDEALIVFEFEKGCEEYYAYYGNPKATSQGSYEPQCGLILETRKRGPGNPSSWADMQQIIKNSPYVYGRGYRTRIFDGSNPFGPSEDYISIYRGYVLAPKDGTYTFCTASDDASFLFINGKMVCQWHGYHAASMGLWGRFAGTINLAKGVHEIEYYHLQATEQSACVAGWKQPGQEDKDVSLIPEWAFPGVFEGREQPQEESSQPLAADFSVDVTTDLVFDECEFQMAKFSARVMAATKIARYEWSFGDGSVSSKSSSVHVYLKPGIYEVTLSVVDDKGRQASVRHKVQIIYILPAGGASYLLERQLKLFEPYMNGYDLTKLPPELIASLWSYYKKVENDQGMKTLAYTALSRLADMPAQGVNDVAEQVGDFFSDVLDKPQDALKAFQFLVDSSSPAVRAKGLIKTGDVHLFKLNDAVKAREFYSKAIDELGKNRSMELRFADIRMGDASKYEGKYDESLSWYSMAEEILLTGRTPRQILTLRGAYAQTVESYMRNRRFDDAKGELDMWEWEFPTERLEGYSTWLRCKLLFAQNKLDDSVREAETLIKVNPRSNYADKLLFIIADCHTEKKDKASAVRALKRIISDYPASPHVPEAKSRISALGG